MNAMDGVWGDNVGCFSTDGHDFLTDATKWLADLSKLKNWTGRSSVSDAID